MLDPAVISAAYRAEVLANRTGVTENVPDKWIGINADARQRCLFDCVYTLAVFERAGDIDTVKYLTSRVEFFRLENYPGDDVFLYGRRRAPEGNV
jgi:hypothetical protein